MKLTPVHEGIVVLRNLFLIVFVIFLSGCGSMADPTTWWDDEGNEIKPSELVEISNELQVRTVWSTDVGSGSGDQHLKLVPRIDGGRVFAADSEGKVVSLDATTGKRLWSIDTELPLSGGPGSGSGVVVVGTRDGEVLALDDTNGEIRWKASVSSEVLSVPAVSAGKVVVQTNDGKLYGFDAYDGTQSWLYSRQVPVLTLRGTSSPVISGNTVFSGFAGGKLVAVELSSGLVQWEISVTAPSGRSELERMVDIDGDPLVSNGVVYVATYQGEVAAISEYSGTVLWQRKLSSYSGLGADWRNVYVSDEKGEVWGISPDNGAAMWKQSKLLNRRLSAPAVIAGYVVVGDYDGYLHWLMHEDGKMVARTRIGGSAISAAPVVSEGMLYVFGDGGALAALKPVL
jgi:outer membrane protein assembly factor BamB